MKNLVNRDEVEVENLPTRESARTPDGWSRHDNDFPWNKLHRFLECRVGNLWNDVFSEFVHLEWIPDRLKTREQLAYSIVMNTFMKDGKVHYLDKWCRGNCEKPIEDYGYGGDCFYVHPTSGKLCYIRKKRVNYEKRRKAEEAKTMRVLGDYHQLLKLNGVWHEVKGEPVQSDVVEIGGLHYREVKPNTIEQYEFRMGTGIKVSSHTEKKYKVIGGRLYVAAQDDRRYMNKPVGPRDRLIEKDRSPYYWNRLNYDGIKLTVRRQLNSKELRKYGLTNDVKPIAGPRCKFCGGLDCKLNHTDRSRYA